MSRNGRISHSSNITIMFEHHNHVQKFAEYKLYYAEHLQAALAFLSIGYGVV